MKNGKNHLFNHHPQVMKLCTKLAFHKFIDEYKIFSSENCEFIIPTFALNKVEDAVKFLSLKDDDDSEWIEKNGGEFTVKHSFFKSTKEAKDF